MPGLSELEPLSDHFVEIELQLVDASELFAFLCALNANDPAGK
jgi:hypothetical protein